MEREHAHDHQHDGHHHHGHDHQGHDHGHHHPVTADSKRRVFQVMLLTGGYMLAQVAGGLLSGSLALLAASGHMLSDTSALGLAWFAFRLGSKPAGASRSYGYHRFQILAAFVNGLSLFAIAGWIVLEAVERPASPVPVLSLPMLAVAVIGLLVNFTGFLILHRGDRENVNLRGALLHVLGDLLGSVAAIAAAGVILSTGWTPIDPLLSVLMAVLILKSAWGLVRRSGHILMGGTPEGVDPTELRGDLLQAALGIQDVHHVHVWALTAERPMVTLHLRLDASAEPEAVLRAAKARLRVRFELAHSTVQVEPEACLDDGHARLGSGPPACADGSFSCAPGEARQSIVRPERFGGVEPRSSDRSAVIPLHAT